MKALTGAVALFLALQCLGASEKHTLKTVSMKIEGTSTLHDWTTKVNTVRANGDFTVQNDQLIEVVSMWVQADAKSIVSEKGDDMDEKIYEALKAEEHPTITFNLSTVKSITKTGSEWIVETKGDLTIAGNKQSIDLTVKASIIESGVVRFTGTKKIKMSQFNIDRPSAMLGLIKSGDEVVITFDVSMKKNS
jgi:hypothetical protein